MFFTGNYTTLPIAQRSTERARAQHHRTPAVTTQSQMMNEDEEDDDVDPYDEMNDDSMELFVIVGAHESYVVRAKYQYDIVVDGDAAPLYA